MGTSLYKYSSMFVTGHATTMMASSLVLAYAFCALLCICSLQKKVLSKHSLLEVASICISSTKLGFKCFCPLSILEVNSGSKASI